MIVCGGTSCAVGQICVDNTVVPNVGSSTRYTACHDNPCAGNALACSCAGALCVGMGAPTCGTLSSTTLSCRFDSVCASPETLIATPSGERRIVELVPGDLVYSVDRNGLQAVPLLRVGHTVVYNHHVIQLTTADGAVLEMSAGHPTADGRTFGQLRSGDMLDGALIESSRTIPYRFSQTYDILPASDTGTYVAAGKLVGSTLR